ACTDVRMHFLVDGQEKTNSVRLSRGASSGWLELGPLTNGPHLLQLRAENFPGTGCNSGTQFSWSGTLEVATNSFVTNIDGGDFPHSGGVSLGVASATTMTTVIPRSL